jgi:group I intron endonuclease
MENNKFIYECTSTVNNKSSNTEIIPIITYSNLDLNKSRVYAENKRKSGIYRLNNLITGKSYVGSSKNLNKRLRSYYYTSNMEKIVNKEKSIIYKAILKYGPSRFSLDILEYCEPNILISREQYYIDLLIPKYNILKIAGSRLGHKLSEKTKKNLSISNRGKKHTYDTIKSIEVNFKPKANILPETRLKMSLRSPGVRVKVFDKSNNLLFEFPTINSAAEYFGVSHSTIRSIEKRGASYDNYTYKFEVKDTRTWVYDNNKKLIKTLNSINKASELFSIPPTTISRYIKSGKLYENTYYFYKSDTSRRLGSKLYEETKLLISNSLKNRLTKLLRTKVMNIETNIIKYFPNNKEAAKYTGTSETTLIRYKSKGKILLKKYLITNNI